MLAGCSLGVLLFAASPHTQDPKNPDIEGPSHGAPPVNDDGRDPSFPRYRLSDIRKHDSKSSEPWVTHDDKVYNITNWIPAHPGGEVILRAAGGSIDPYWDIFAIHKAPYVYEILSQYLIGYIDSADLVDGKPAAEDIEDPFKDDPTRDTRLLTHTARPRNAEPPSEELRTEFLTPNELFYVRNHMWVPVVGEEKAKTHTLTVELPDGEVKTYTLDDLRHRFKTHTLTATLQCSGNRRNDMTRHAGETNGLQWGVGAISNAEWEGVRLVDVLADAGLRTSGPSEDARVSQPNPDEAQDAASLHVQFSGLEAYAASIPLPAVLDPRGDVLLAFSMNGQPLPRDHGYPLRAVVPGYVAARSVKWLSKIVVADEESTSQWQRRDYKCFGPNEGARPNWDRYPSIQEMPITSAVTGVWVGDCVRGSKEAWMRQKKEDCARAEAGVKDVDAWQRENMPKEKRDSGEPVAVAGYAYSGGGREIVRVDVSVDGGKTWDQAELLRDCDAAAADERGGSRCKGNKAWAWKRWRYTGSLPQFSSSPSTGAGDSSITSSSAKTKVSGEEGRARCTDVLVKATDDAYNTQPEHHAAIYNVRGNLATAWHRVRVCPACTTAKDGTRSWRTGEALYGCGFAEEEDGNRPKREGPSRGKKS